jgi:hypothetical protein
MTELTRHCDLCGALQTTVYAYEPDPTGQMRRKIRKGWLCTACWPTEGSYHKAILRERYVDPLKK